MTTTYREVLDRHRVEIPAHLVADAEIPVLAGLQAQGDVLIVPVRPSAKLSTPVPAEGVPVVRGEATGHTHLLTGEGIGWAPATGTGQVLGVVSVPDGAAGFLLHPEHGANGLAAGCYELRRQVEYADEIRLVHD